jgi:Ca2+-binding RTX toxin-like protein
MKRITTLTGLVGLLVALCAGVALAAVLTCSGGRCEGTLKDDAIEGSDERDIIYAKDGRDNVDAGGGNDTVYGGKGSDGGDAPNAEGVSPELDGNAGNDTIYGGKGADDLDENNIGSDGNDRLFGEEGNEVDIHGHAGNDLIHGGDGNDQNLNGDEGNNRIFGDRGADEINADGFESEDKVFGGKGDDLIDSRDDTRDVVDCGPQTDLVEFDEGLDEIADNCEIQNPAMAVLAQQASSGSAESALLERWRNDVDGEDH